MPRAANAFGQWQLMVRAPGKEPCLHVLMPDVVPRLYLLVCLAQLRQHLSLHVMGRACVRHEHILTPGSGFTENTKCGFRDSALVELPEAAWCDKSPRAPSTPPQSRCSLGVAQDDTGLEVWLEAGRGSQRFFVAVNRNGARVGSYLFRGHAASI